MKSLAKKAHAIGLTHQRSPRPLGKSEIHRILNNPIYYGEFLWLGRTHTGTQEPLITRSVFDEVQAILRRKPRARYPRQRHPFMGLLSCALCGCSITAEQKKGKYVYYHCTNFRGACENTYIRQDRLAELLGDVIKPIHIPDNVAVEIAQALRSTTAEEKQTRESAVRQLDQRRRTVTAKLDRGYEDLLEGRISEEFWGRKSAEWERELRLIDGEKARFSAPRADTSVTVEKILELAKNAEILYKSQDSMEQRRLLETVLSNCSFDRGSLLPTYNKPFDLFVLGNETGEWRGRRDSNPRPLP